MERHRGLREPHPAEHAAYETVPLRHGAERVDGLAVDEPEVADVGGDVDVGQRTDELVEQRCRPKLQARFAVSADTQRVDDLEALPPLRGEVEDDFRWILQVGVHHDDGVAGRAVHAGRDRDLMSEIAR